MKKILLLFAIGCYATSLFAQDKAENESLHIGSWIDEASQMGWHLHQDPENPENYYTVLFSPYSCHGGAEQTIEAANKDSFTLEILIIPDSVEYGGQKYRVASIGQYAFQGCESLKHIEIPEGVDSICKQAFYKCNSITNIEIPSTIISIGTGAFRVDNAIIDDYGTLTFKTDEDGNSCLKTIGDYVFQFDQTKGTHYSGDLNLPNSVETIGTNAFTRAFRDNRHSGTLHLPESLKELGQSAFQGCTGFKGNLIIPGTLSEIQTQTFQNTQNFSSILIEEGVKIINDKAFENCSKNESNDTIRIPSTVHTIGTTQKANGAFFGCRPSVVDIYATTPPTMGGQQFETVMDAATFIIPCASLHAYRSATYWEDIQNYALADAEGGNTPYPNVRIMPENAATCSTSYDCTTREYTMELTLRDSSYIFSHWEDKSISTTRKEIIPEKTAEKTTFIAYYKYEIEVTEWTPSQITIETTTQDLSETSYTASIGLTQQMGELVSISNGIWKINTDLLHLQEHPNETLSIIITKGTSTLHFETTIPLIITDKKTTSALGDILTTTTDVVVNAGGELEVDAPSYSINDLYIYAEGTCIFNEPFTIKTLYLRADATADTRITEDSICRKFPTMTVNRDLTVTSKKMYYDYTLDRQGQYSIVLPYDVKPDNVTHANGEEVKIGIIYYDPDSEEGFRRVKAQDIKKNWKFENGTCYRVWATPRTWNGKLQEKAKVRFYMPMDYTRRVRTDSRSVAVYGTSLILGANNSQNNWNMVGNPFITIVEGKGAENIRFGQYQMNEAGEWEHTSEQTRYLVTPNDPDGQSYTWKMVKDYELRSGEWFFVQVNTNGTLTFHRQTKTTATNIVARKTNEYTSAAKEHSVRLTMTAPDGTSDKTGLFISELYTPNYDFNADLARFFSGQESMTFYGITDAGRLFCNAIAPDEAETGCRLGYYTRNTGGTFRIKIDDTYDVSDFEGIWLTDSQTGTTVNLLYNTYTFTCSEQQNDTRFSVACKLRQTSKPTGLDVTEYDIYAYGEQGTLLLSRLPEYTDVYVSDATGKLVYSSKDCSNTIRCAVPQSGCYLIRLTTPAGNQVLRAIIK